MTTLSCVVPQSVPVLRDEKGPRFAIHFEDVTSIPDPLGIYGETLIGRSRSGRPLPETPRTPAPTGSCPFCEIAARNESRRVQSPDNLHPFGPILHKVLAISAPLHDSVEISAETIEHLYEEACTIASSGLATYGPLLDGITYGMNCGDYQSCGASQRHIHSQLTGLTRGSFNAGDRFGVICRAWQEQFSTSYIDDYLAALRRPIETDAEGVPTADNRRVVTASNLILAEDQYSVLYVPVGQRFRCELQIVLKQPGLGHILQTSPPIRRSLAAMEHLAISFFQGMGLTSHNSLTIATRFSAQNTYDQRFLVSVFPRVGILAYSELLGRYVVDETPWKCADNFRRHLKAQH